MINRAGIDSLNRHSVLDAVVEVRRGSDRCEADLLMLAAHFADLHPSPTEVSAPDTATPPCASATV